jgi:uncharacterized membrane protein YbhN (UPF0104 family)/tRNA A-37 threonylcarbamoyl transferase component Bud32
VAERDQGVGTGENRASRWGGGRLLSRAITPIRFFSSAAAAPRARRPTDVMLLIASVVGVAITTVLAPDPADRASATTAFLRSLPGLLGWFWEISYVLVFVWVAILLGAPLVSRGRLRLSRDQLLALILASVGSLFLAGDWSTMMDGLTSSGPPPVFPAVRIALVTAILVTTSPHLGMPSRRAGRLFLAIGTLASIALGSVQPVGVIAGLSLGTAAATLVHLIFGSPGGRPTRDQVAKALADIGFETKHVEHASLRSRGVGMMRAVTQGGETLLVKVYGRDAWDGQLLSSIWSFLWYRDETPTLTLSRLQQVEHEAFVTLLAERAHVPVLPVVAAGPVANDALLVVDFEGEPMSSSEGTSDEMLADLWRGVSRMHRAGIAHRALDADRLVVQGTPSNGRLAIGDFGRATAVASDGDVHADRAQLLATTAFVVGTDRALAVASRELGDEALTGLLAYLQAAALTPATRERLKSAQMDLDALRNAAAEAAGAKEPELVPLRRVTWGSLLQIALIAIGAWVVMSAIANVGLDTIVQELSGANWPWVIFALVMSPTVQVAEALSTLGASIRPLRFGPVLLLQFAVRFIALAVPSSAARIALSVRFFQRSGAPTSEAIAIGAIDSVSGFVIQAFILAIIAMANLVTLDLAIQNRPDRTGKLLILGAVVVVILVVAAMFVPRIRRMIAPHLTDARTAARVFREPMKLLQLFGGNMAAQLLLAGLLGLCLRAFGQQATMAELLVANTLTSLLSGVVPVPGGIGVSEATTTTLLVAMGFPQSPALAATLMFRIITFYLPPAWGVFSMRSLKRNGSL